MQRSDDPLAFPSDREDTPGADAVVDDYLLNFAPSTAGRRARPDEGWDFDPVAPRPAAESSLRLALGSLGVVFGDIGTSPLYAFKACFFGDHAVAPSQGNILGVLSLIFWSLTLVVSVKYVTFIMRADYKGDGGIFALLYKLRQTGVRMAGDGLTRLVFFTLLGAALFFADGMITPAISVLSAVEGLEVVTHVAGFLVLPLTVAILAGLFYLQRRGSGGIGRLFGPVMAVWFMAIGLFGLAQIAAQPVVLLAVNPAYAVGFFVQNGLAGLAVLGAVTLCITGCEALYADMGHFGARPIRISWYVLVFPALVLNYFGQGAGLLTSRAILANPFYGIVPPGLLLPVVLLATMATICASQAMISGVFSLVRQAVSMGYFPHLPILQTSRTISGQVYIPAVNTAMMTASIGLVLLFRDSVNLAGAYGIAVTGTMAITTGIFFFVLMRAWGWSERRAAAVVTAFLVVDGLFFGANLMKFFDGGWLILLASAFFLVCMLASGAHHKAAWDGMFSRSAGPWEPFLAQVEALAPPRLPGTAVFLSRSAQAVPRTLARFLGEHQVLHERVVVVAVAHSAELGAPEASQLRVASLGLGISLVSAAYGVVEDLDLPRLLAAAAQRGLPLSGELVYCLDSRPARPWRTGLFQALSELLSRWARREPAAVWPTFGVPENKVMEVRA